MLPSLALVGPAGVGKTTLAGLLRDRFHYQVFALADPIKIGLAFLEHLILDQPFAISIEGEPATAYAATEIGPIDRILTGTMGSGINGFSSLRYYDDVSVRESLLSYARGEKERFRATVQTLGTEMIRAKAAPANPWLDCFLREAGTSRMTFGRPVVCDDVRFPDEADALRADGFVVVRVSRANARGAGITAATGAHISEHAHETIVADHLIANDGDPDLLGVTLFALLTHLQSLVPQPKGIR